MTSVLEDMPTSGTRSSKAARLRVTSVSTLLPSPHAPDSGVFIGRRLSALAQLADVSVVNPSPWFPLLRPFPSGNRQWEMAGTNHRVPVVTQRMFYVPKFLKQWDGRWLERSILPPLRHAKQSGSIDLIDAQFAYPVGVGSYRVGRRLGIPVFITIRGVETEQLQDPALAPQLIEAMTGCAGIVSVSHSLKADAVAAGVPAERVEVIPNAVDTDTFRPGSRAEARRKLGIDDDARVLICVGHYLKVKGHDRLLPAFARLYRQDPKVRLVLIGGAKHEPQYARDLDRSLDEMGIRGAIVQPGIVAPDEVATWLRAADLFTLMSRREGCCNALLEALACGIPAVVTAVGDNAHFVRPGVSGALIADASDVDRVARELEDALGQSWDPEAIAAPITGHDWAQVAQRTVEFFRRCPGGS